MTLPPDRTSEEAKRFRAMSLDQLAGLLSDDNGSVIHRRVAIEWQRRQMVVAQEATAAAVRNSRLMMWSVVIAAVAAIASTGSVVITARQALPGSQPPAATVEPPRG